MKTARRVLELMCWICVALFLCVGAAAAQGLMWPVEANLVAKDWTQPSEEMTLVLGEVKVWHTREALEIQVIPGTLPDGRDLTVKEISIATANPYAEAPDVPDFSAVLDKHGRPDPSQFPYKTDYLGDEGEPAEEPRVFSIPVSTFGLCWGYWEKCPLDRYVMVHVELMMEVEEGVWEVAPEPAYADGDGALLDSKDRVTARYLIYPFAKVETGHFVDAKVRGLTFATATQYGTSSDSGNFFYIPPERVHFSVGSLSLGSAVGDHTLSPMDLFDGSSLDHDGVLNVARVLQSLDSNPQAMLIDVTENTHCVDEGLTSLGWTGVDFEEDDQVDDLLAAMQAACPALEIVSKDIARANLDQGQQAANLLKTNISKSAALVNDKAKIDIMPFYVPAQTANGTPTDIVYHDAEGNVIESRDEAKPLVVTYEEEDEETGASDVVVAISRDDGSTWKRRNISKTAGRSSLTTTLGVPYPGECKKPMLQVKGNLIFLAWTSKYCHGGRPAYAIRRLEDRNCSVSGGDTLDGVLHETHEGLVCKADYPGDDAYWRDDIFGVGGPQRSVTYDPLEWPEMGEVAYSCVWTARGKIEADGSIVWFKPEKITSGRRDAIQLVAAAADGTGFAIAWQEDPKGLRPPSDYGPGDGWSGANVSNKTDIWYSSLPWEDFDKVDGNYTPPDNEDIVDTDPELGSRLKALVPFSLPVKISDNDACNYQNILAEGGDGHDTEEEDGHVSPGNGIHRYCGTLEGIGEKEAPGPNPLCAFTVPITNHDGETHDVCVTAEPVQDGYGRVLDGNTGASRPNLFLQPYQKSDGTKSAWAILAYEESKGMGSPPEVEGEDDEDRYKADLGKNVIYHSFDFTDPETVSGGGIVNQPEMIGGSPVYAVDEFGNYVLDPLGRMQLAYENARRARLLPQPKSKVGASGTVLVTLYRQGEEGHGKAADIFMRRVKASSTGNPYAFQNFVPGAQNLSSVEPGEIRDYDVVDPGTGAQTTIHKMVNWTWDTKNLSDQSGTEPYSDSRAHRGAINGDELIIGFIWTPNWGRLANDKYDLYVRRSWDGGQTWKTDPKGSGPIDHTIVFVDPVTKEETVTITSYLPGALEPPRNISNLRNNRITVLEPRLVKTPGTITRPDGSASGYLEDKRIGKIYQVAWGLEVNDPGGMPDDQGHTIPFRTPLDIYYGRTTDKGQNFEKVIITRADGQGRPEEGWNLLAKDKPAQSGAQVKQTPDGSRMYAVWVEKTAEGGDIMFRRVDYRPAPTQ